MSEPLSVCFTLLLALVHVVRHTLIWDTQQPSTGYGTGRETERLIDRCSSVLTVHKQGTKRQVLGHRASPALCLPTVWQFTKHCPQMLSWKGCPGWKGQMPKPFEHKLWLNNGFDIIDSENTEPHQ